MAKDNKTIGKFRLKGIKRAPAGVPQIEVTFDIDTNGILTVSAKDLDTGKEQSITITANDRMSEAEIEQAIRDASEYAGQDQMRVDAMELTREAQSLVTQVQRALKEEKKNLDKADKKQIKNDCNTLQKLLNKCRLDKISESELEEIRRAKEQLTQSATQIIS